MAQYFRLASDCYLVGGENDCAIYAPYSYRIFPLDERAHRLLRRCEENVPLRARLSKPERKLVEAVRDAGLGHFVSGPVFIDKFRLNQPVAWKGMAQQPPQFLKADIAITNDCDLNCQLCGRQSETISWQSCKTCLRRDTVRTSAWTSDDLQHLVSEIARLGVTIVHIRGGNPLLRWNELQQVRESIQRRRLQLIITTPGTGRSIEELINFCLNGQVILNVLLFGTGEEGAATFCGQSSVFRHQEALLDALSTAKLPFVITGLLTTSTRQYRHRFVEYVQKRWNVEASIAEIHERKSIDEGFRLSHVSNECKPLTPWLSQEEFFDRSKFNTCLYGTFEVGADGGLRSCAGLHTEYGNVPTSGLRRALSNDEFYELWQRSKETIEPCSKCALRYACADCSVFELEGELDKHIKTAYCPHNPTSGEQRACSRSWVPSELVSMDLVD